MYEFIITNVSCLLLLNMSKKTSLVLLSTLAFPFYFLILYCTFMRNVIVVCDLVTCNCISCRDRYANVYISIAVEEHSDVSTCDAIC